MNILKALKQLLLCYVDGGSSGDEIMSPPPSKKRKEDPTCQETPHKIGHSKGRRGLNE
jgi:hypothetical protein